MLTQQQNEMLTRVGPGTPMGEVMRRYWIPALLSWARNEENGIRCVYHGWKFDVAGRCADMPSEPATSNFKDRVQIPAYATYEVGGVVWAYMGPAAKKPAPPLFEWTQVPPSHRGMSKV